MSHKLLIITALLTTIGLAGLIIDTTTPEPPHDVVTVKTIQHPPAEYEAFEVEHPDIQSKLKGSL